MKKLAVSFFILALTTCSIFSQEQSQETEKKVYRSEDNDKLYVNKDLGVYIWLSTSPDPESEKIRLESDSTQKYANPMYFDTEGYNTIRSPWIVDTATKKPIYPQQDIIFEVYADGLPPVSKSYFQSTASKYINKKSYYGSDLKVEIRASDAVSGIYMTSYSLNDNEYVDYTAALTEFKEGENILKYQSTDKVGNQEKLREEVFFLDKTPPVTEFVIDGLTNEKYVSPSSSIQLNSTDSLSGVKAIYYSINNRTLTRYSKPIPVSVLGTGEGTISFYAIDNLGNKEKEQIIGGKGTVVQAESGSPDENVTFEFYVDNDPPSIELLIENDSYEGKYNFISARSKFKINAEDNKAGVDKVFYSINSKVIDHPYNEAFSIEKEGLKYIRMKAVDYVGNVSPVLIQSYFCDISAPEIKLVVGSPKFVSRDTLFVSEKTKFSISATDNQSGVKSVQYSINSGDQSDYEQSFVVDKSGMQTISYKGSDNVNNQTELKSQAIFVDNIAPVIHHHFSVESIGKKTVRDEEYTIYPTNAMLYIAATDASSGGEKIEYRINGGNLLSANPIKKLAPGNYLIEVDAFDVLGNKRVEKIKFAIEE